MKRVTLNLIILKTESGWHQIETFPALLAICERNSPVTGEFPSQRPVTRSFDVFIWSAPEQNSGDLRRHRVHDDVNVMNAYIYIYICNSWTNDALMLTHFMKIWIKIHLISCKKMALRTSSAVVGWVNKREAGDLKRYRAHYDVTVMMVVFFQVQCLHIIHC